MADETKDVGVKVGGVQVGPGIGSKPAIAFQQDDDTGFGLAAPGVIGVYAAGVEVGRLPDDLGSSPPGADTQVIYNDAGVLGADAGFTFNETTNVATLAGGLVSPSAGPAAAQQHTLPAVASDTVALIAATQTLTNKTLTAAVLGGITNVSGGQLQFPAVQAPSAGVNILDDYEEGTFTPEFTAATPPTGVTYSAQAGSYTKIGNAVVFRLRVQLSSKGAGGAGAMQITGLPFTASAAAPPTQLGCGYDFIDLNTAGGFSDISAQISTGTSLLQLQEQGDNVSAASITWADVANNSDFIISGSYHA